MSSKELEKQLVNNGESKNRAKHIERKEKIKEATENSIKSMQEMLLSKRNFTFQDIQSYSSKKTEYVLNGIIDGKYKYKRTGFEFERRGILDISPFFLTTKGNPWYDLHNRESS